MPQNNNASSSGQSSSPLDRYTVQPPQKQDDSPFYKSAAPSISLPKGGGALKGIDEKFSVNAVNGTAGLEIPLPLSPGRGGFTPALSLSYNSGSGNSEFGLGFGLGLPGIQRKTDKQLPRYNDAAESDVFLLAGAEDLVPLLDDTDEPDVETIDSYTIRRYRPRIEGLFARIEYIKETTGGSGGWWRVTTKGNITTYYGLTAEGRLADPENEYRIFKWLPQLTVDHKGNVQQYVYVKEDNKNIPATVNEKNRLNGNATFTNIYLKRVLYCNRTPYFIDEAMPQPAAVEPSEVPEPCIIERNIYKPELSRTTEAITTTISDKVIFLMEAVLDYGDHNDNTYPDYVPEREANQNWPARSDAFSDFHAGFEIRTYRKCRRVLMFHHFKELKEYDETKEEWIGKDLVRSLELGYKNPVDPITLQETTDFTEADLIISATQRGYTYDYDTQLWHNKALPAMTFHYRPLEWNKTIHKVDKQNFRNAPQGLTGPYQWMDFEGEGISGILTEQAGGWFYKNNLGNVDKLGNVGKVHFDTAKPIAQKPNFTGLGGGGLQWQDLDADGRRQVVAEAPAKGFWELDNDQRWQPFRTFSKNGNIDLNSPFTKMLDLNGDGKADLLITEDRAWTWYENLGKEGFERGGNAAVFNDEEKGPVLLLRDAVQSIFLADINGDGMTDLVRIKNREICYWPNMGYGKFGAKVTMANAPVFQSPDNYNPLYLSLADISGTGAADLIYVGKNKCTAWINLAGNAWSDAMEINPLPGTDAMSKISVVDFLGNGTACIVWSSPLPQHATAPLQYIDLMDGKKPYLMSSYNSGMGKTVSVKYKSSTQFYLDDKLNGIPWATKLPFPVQCIEKVTTEDLVSGTSYTQSYSYRHGYYDHEEREFRGFGYVETKDIESVILSGTEALDQHPVITKTWNHTGAWIRGKALLDQYKNEYYQFEGWDDVVDVAELPPAGDLNAPEWREAYRALKGSPLRQEVYAIDGTEKQDIPFTVTATAYKVILKQKQHGNRHACFINLQQQSVAYSGERDFVKDTNGNGIPGRLDVRVAQQLTLQVDAYGNVLKSASIAYPRRYVDAALPLVVREEQAKMHISYTEQDFTNDIPEDANHYRLRVGCGAKAYEVLGITSATDGLWTIADLSTKIAGCNEIDFSATASGSAEKRLLSHSKVLFKANDASDAPLAWQMLEFLSIPHEQYQLAFTGDVLEQCYGSLVAADTLADAALKTHYSYWRWDTVNMVMVEEPGGLIGNAGEYWIPSGNALYTSPLTRFFTPEKFIDPWGNKAAVEFWDYPDGSTHINYWLLPRRTIDALGNISMVVSYDWRLLQPLRMTDANENGAEILYDALGLPVAMAMKGKVDANFNSSEGDTLEGLDLYAVDGSGNNTDAIDQRSFFDNDPESFAAGLLKNATWRCVYDFETAPVAVGMIARQQHYHGGDPALPPVIRISYSDGMGRVMMHKAQAEPDLDTPNLARWIGSGRTIYNNKGNAVMQFEPYFSHTHDYDRAEANATVGVSPRLYYDALGRNYRTELPDGSYTKTVWTAWEQLVYDNNDTVGLGEWSMVNGEWSEQSDWFLARIAGQMGNDEQNAAEKALAHANTPTVMHTDTLARPFYTVQILKAGPTVAEPVEAIYSYVELDVLGNRIAVVDGNGNVPLQYRYNMLKQVCRQESIDSGTGHTLIDVAGQPLYAWDADNREFEMVYDELRRVTQKWCGDKGLELMVYGDNEDVANTVAEPVEALNLRGQLYAHYDGSGKQWMPDGYDFKGNPVKTTQSLLSDKTITDADWVVLDDTDLDSEVWTATMELDALNRPLSITDQGKNITRHTYDKAGALKKVWLAPFNTASLTDSTAPINLPGTAYVKDIRYDAKGQRQSIWYGNHTKTRYTYDPLTYRLKRLLTTKRIYDTTEQAYVYSTLQDLNYYYDPVGNITTIRDDAQPVLFCSNQLIEPAQHFTYDSLYRLIIATGREQKNAADPTATDNTDDAAVMLAGIDNNAVQNYTQTYSYDAVGNIMKLQHRAKVGSYTRHYVYQSGNNRLIKVSANNEPNEFTNPPALPDAPDNPYSHDYDYGYGNTSTYDYDKRGNMLKMPHLNAMHWNASNELYQITKGTGIDTIVTNYQYSGGQRIRKFTDKGNIKEERIYFGSFEIYRKFGGGSSLNDIDLERTAVHISDDTGRIAMLEVRNPLYSSDNLDNVLSRYVYSNHLQSATLECDGEGNIISYEEYHSYGTTAYQAKSATIAACAKRYRYTGKERDEESGLYYHGARYYIPWLCRWTSVDPLESKYGGRTPYCYSVNNPVVYNDPNGMQEKKGNETPEPTSGIAEKHNDKGYTGEALPPTELDEIIITTEKKASPPSKPGFWRAFGATFTGDWHEYRMNHFMNEFGISQDDAVALPNDTYVVPYSLTSSNGESETNYFIFRKNKRDGKYRHPYSKENDDYWLSEEQLLNTNILGNQGMDAPGLGTAGKATKYTVAATKFSFRQLAGIAEVVSKELKGSWKDYIKFNVPDVTGISGDVLKKGFHLHFKGLKKMEMALVPMKGGKIGLSFISGRVEDVAIAIKTFNQAMASVSFRNGLLISLKATQEALISGSKILKTVNESQMAIDKAHEINYLINSVRKWTP